MTGYPPAGGYQFPPVTYEGPGAQKGHIPRLVVHVTPASPDASVASLRRYGASVTHNLGSLTAGRYSR